MHVTKHWTYLHSSLTATSYCQYTVSTSAGNATDVSALRARYCNLIKPTCSKTTHRWTLTPNRINEAQNWNISSPSSTKNFQIKNKVQWFNTAVAASRAEGPSSSPEPDLYRPSWTFMDRCFTFCISRNVDEVHQILLHLSVWHTGSWVSSFPSVRLANNSFKFV